MNSLVVGLIGLVLLLLGYRFYGKIIERLWGIDSKRKTPAVENPDGVDYVPARHWSILFGHHFSSIAGAGPILGPVIACCLWGWLPAVLWIVLGTIFIGGVHDLSSLVASLRHKGRSIADVAQDVMSYRAKMLLASFLWLTLILVVAVFAAVGGKTLAVKPQIVIPTFGLILVALLIGFSIYKLKINQVLATIIGIGLLFGLILLGYHYPITMPGEAARNWTIILLIYAAIASVIPVNILLQPRDYLAAFVLFFGLLFGFLGLLIIHPTIHTPAFIKWQATEGTLWPMMCVIIACGAISGFHSLVASGTTSKQLANEKDAKKIGYGSMVAEGILALLAILAVSAGLYWKGGSAPEGLCPGGKGSLVYPVLMKKKGWIVTFGEGYGQLVKPIFGTLGTLVAITMVKTFVMTTLDTATRINRYILEELFSEGLGLRLFKNRYLSTAIVISLAAFLALGNWKAIWPVFGAANQLVAALALIIVTVYLSSLKKAIKYTLPPALFMLATTIGALIYQLIHFIPQKKYLLSSVSIVLLILAFFVILEAVKVFRHRKQS